MNRSHLEHIIRAASGITNQADIVVIGSQALAKRIATLPMTPEALTLIQERLRRIEPRENRIRPGDGSC